MTPLNVLDPLLDPVASFFTPEGAKQLVAFRADAKTQARIDELADKSTAGALTDAECREYDAYLAAIDFITVLQIKARSIIERASTS